MKCIILGSGSSPGVPEIGPDGWGVCDAGNPKNRRTRASILLQSDGVDMNVLVDTSPDLREQLIRECIHDLGGVLMTHAHSDHIAGIDDLRGVNRVMGQDITFYSAAHVLEEVRHRFGYVFAPLRGTTRRGIPSYYKPVLVPYEITSGKPFTVRQGDAAMTFMPFEQDHGFCTTMGYRTGDFAYSTDVKRLSPQAFEVLEGVRVWVVGAPTNNPEHPTHIHVDGVLEWAERLGPSRVVLSHLGAQLDYETLCRRLPGGIEPAYDGMEIAV